MNIVKFKNKEHKLVTFEVKIDVFIIIEILTHNWHKMDNKNEKNWELQVILTINKPKIFFE